MAGRCGEGSAAGEDKDMATESSGWGRIGVRLLNKRVVEPRSEQVS
jgi:hypothetical protein